MPSRWLQVEGIVVMLVGVVLNACLHILCDILGFIVVAAEVAVGLHHQRMRHLMCAFSRQTGTVASASRNASVWAQGVL